MKASAIVPIVMAALMSTSVMAAPVIIAGTSFENETAYDGDYFDTGNPLVNHALTNNPGQPVVTSTAASTAAGDLGFGASFLYTGYDSEGMTDGAEVGITNNTSVVGSFANGTQGYAISDTDGAVALTFDSVSLTSYTNATFFMRFYIAETGWEGDEYLKISLLLDGNQIDLLDTTGQDIDNQYHHYEGEWTPISYGIGDSVENVALIVEGSSNGGTERFFLDEVRFQGEEIPEPASLTILTLGGLLALRRKK